MTFSLLFLVKFNTAKYKDSFQKLDLPEQVKGPKASKARVLVAFNLQEMRSNQTRLARAGAQTLASAAGFSLTKFTREFLKEWRTPKAHLTAEAFSRGLRGCRGYRPRER